MGCSSQTVVLVHPKTGATTKCAATGTGVAAAWVATSIGDCIREGEDKGYVVLDQLTPAERADLEKRGLLPKD
jgi:hypothetical protein